MRYEVLEHTADVMIKAHGITIEECFQNAAFAMMDQIVDASSAEAKVEEHITAEGSTLDDLLYNFLSEVLFIFDAKGLLLSEFDVTISDGMLKCRAKGERFDAMNRSTTRFSP